MNEKLLELNNKEIEIKRFVEGLTSTLEIRRRQIFETAIPEKYRIIHSEYSNLAENSLEALKRAVFLQWYSVVEPLEFSGLDELNSKDILHNFLILDNLHRESKIDNELLEMIKFYFRISDWYFLKYLKYSRLIELMLSTQSEQPSLGIFKNMSDRGLMGNYWKEIIENDH